MVAREIPSLSRKHPKTYATVVLEAGSPCKNRRLHYSCGGPVVYQYVIAITAAMKRADSRSFETQSRHIYSREEIEGWKRTALNFLKC